MGQLSAQALVGVGEARTFVLRKPTDGSQDELLIDLINSVSQTIKRLLPRQLFKEDAASHSFEYDGSGFLDLNRFELRAVTLMTVQKAYAASPDTLDPAVPDYTLQPVEKTEEGTYTWLRLRKVDNPRAYPPTSRVGFMSTVAITGDWGMLTIPDDIKQACKIGVRWHYKNPDGQQSVHTGEVNIGGFPMMNSRYVDPLPPEAMALLDNFSRPDIGV